MSKKIIALFLLVVMVLSCCLASCGDNNAETSDGSGTNPNRKIEAGTKVVLGSVTQLGGDFRWPGFGASSANAADQEVSRLLDGYATLEVNREGDYQWNETAVKSHTGTENEDGTYTFTIELNEGLKFSDGSDVKAQNYVGYLLAFSSPVAAAAKHSAIAGQSFVGFNEFKAYTGVEVDPDSVDVEDGGVVPSKEFAGVRLLSDYSFSITVSTDFYPFYFVDSLAAISPYYLELMVGKNVEVKDDGNGAYLSDAYYEKNGDQYVKADELSQARFDVTMPFTGPYVISEWDKGTAQVTLKANPEYKGNFEGMTPAIETIVYTLIIEETQVELLKTGAVDVLSGVTGGTLTKNALAVVNDGDGFKETHYQRAGYGKIQFECDFGPTMFAEVRQAVAYLLNRSEFCNSFTGGYGSVVEGPYSPDFAVWKAVKDGINITSYEYSPANARKVLEEGGWIYNSKGEPFEPGASGVDSVRYKKLTEEEAAVLDGVNKNYASVANTDKVAYKTVEIDGEYYMPLVINWFGTEDNSVTDMLSTAFSADNNDLAETGLLIRATTGDFDKLLGEIQRDTELGYGGTPTYGMYNLATGWPTAVYDYSFNWSIDPNYFAYSTNKLYDEYDVDFTYDQSGEKLSYDEAMERSGGKLGMDYLSMGMVYNVKSGETEQYNKWWQAYIERWNALMPDIPLYSNFYYDVYNAKIENFETSPFFGVTQAILYANIAG